jgi:hypothetical protein
MIRNESGRLGKYSELNLGGWENIKNLFWEGGNIFRFEPGRVGKYSDLKLVLNYARG